MFVAVDQPHMKDTQSFCGHLQHRRLMAEQITSNLRWARPTQRQNDFCFRRSEIHIHPCQRKEVKDPCRDEPGPMQKFTWGITINHDCQVVGPNRPHHGICRLMLNFKLPRKRMSLITALKLECNTIVFQWSHNTTDQLGEYERKEHIGQVIPWSGSFSRPGQRVVPRESKPRVLENFSEMCFHERRHARTVQSPCLFNLVCELLEGIRRKL